MDFDSAIVRGTAVQAIGKIMDHGADSLPGNMLEMVIVYLNDTYVYVHKAATHAVRSVKPMSFEQAADIAFRLLGLDQAYQEEPDFRREILRSVLHVTRAFPSLLEKLTVPLILSHTELKDQYVEEDALLGFERILHLLPEQYAPILGRKVIEYLGRSQRDLYSNERFSDRHRLYSSLFKLPRNAVVQCIDVTKTAVLKKAKDDPWDALKLVQLLIYFEFHKEASDLASIIANEQPRTKKYERVVRESLLIGSMATAETLVTVGRPDLAIKVLNEVRPLEAERHEQDENQRIDDVIDTFKVAERVARQLRLVQDLRSTSEL
jgi:hypothetical protein